MRRITGLMLLLSLIGCSDGPPELVPVTGTVRLDGRPLSQGVILFENEGAPPATGKIVNGEILEVTTHELGDGVLTGEKKMTVRPSDESTTTSNNFQPAATRATFGKTMIPPRYFDPTTSGLTCDIVDGPNKLVFTLITEPSVPTPTP